MCFPYICDCDDELDLMVNSIDLEKFISPYNFQVHALKAVLNTGGSCDLQVTIYSGILYAL